MFRILKLVILGILFLNLTPGQGLAQPAEKSFDQLVYDLSLNPSNDAVREQIIKDALTQTPPPAFPEEAERRFFRGMAAMKSASTVEDFKSAAREFEMAIAAAPWHADAYYNAGVANNRAGNYSAAKKNFSFYLLAAPDAPDANEVKALVYENEYLAEQAEMKQRERREAEAEKARLERLVQPFMGPWVYRFCLVKNSPSCNEKEANGSNWYATWEDNAMTIRAITYFDFPGNGTVEIPHSYCGRIVGFPQGGNLSNTRWEVWPNWPESHQSRQVWSVTSYSYVKFSCDRPMDKSRYNRKTRYQYELWQKQ